MRHQGPTPINKRSMYKSHHALKLSCIILCTKSKRGTFVPQLRTSLQLYKIFRKQSLKSLSNLPMPLFLRIPPNNQRGQLLSPKNPTLLQSSSPPYQQIFDITTHKAKFTVYASAPTKHGNESHKDLVFSPLKVDC